ncbi:tetratricopeptide repeat protein [Poseidonibacter antarcticus]|uniref:tetratricopeptide repeat protein n=1 Tax=Poseidonibacter antarcticus TaxID=2478538 RepID=UPI000EF4B76F|nr:tetratricopeptide repeat protein [Poseidonibacter antarcticus]
MQNQIITKLEKYLVYEDKLKLNTLNTTLKVRPKGAYISLIGVDSDELLNAFKEYLTTFENTEIFNYKSEQIIDEIITLNKEKTYIIDIYNIPDSFDIKNIVQHFRFNRDFIPDKNIRIFILASNKTLDVFSEKAYDFVTFNNFYGKFKDNKFDFNYKVNSEKLDKLIKEYKDLKPNTAKKIQIDKMIKIAKEAENIAKNDISLKYLNMALPKAKKIKNNSILGLLYTAFGNIYFQSVKYDLALRYYNYALKIAQEINDSLNKATLLSNIGNIYLKYNIEDKSLLYYKKAEKINKKLNNKYGLSNNYISISEIYINYKDYDKAFEYLEKSFELAVLVNDNFNISKYYNNKGVIYLECYDLNKALELFQKGLTMAKNYLYHSLIIAFLMNIARVYKLLLNFDLSLKYFHKALVLNKESKYIEDTKECEMNINEIENILNGVDTHNYFNTLVNKDSKAKDDIIKYLIYEANILKEKKNYNEAKEKLQESEKIANEINLKGLLCEVYMSSYDFYKTINDSKIANKYYNKAKYIIKNSGHKLFEKRLSEIKNSHL